MPERTQVMLAHALLIVAVILVGSSARGAQPDTITVAGDILPAKGRLNTVLDSIKAAGTLSSTVVRLVPGNRYILTSRVTIPFGQCLTLVAPEPGELQESAPPMLLWSQDAAVESGIFFDVFGTITLKNVWMLFARTDGWHSFSSIVIEDRPDAVHGQQALFDNVIFDYAAIGFEGSGCVCVKARHFRGVFRNCYFRNCTDPHFRYYGRAVSFPFNSSGWHTDSLCFDNCTFANIGYVVMQEGGEYADHLWFNHCTFLNVVMFTLESGWWRSLSVANSVFVNTHFFGDTPGMRWPDTSQAYGATIRIDSISAFGFPVPFTEAQRHILFTHCSYATEDWLRDYMLSGYDSALVKEPWIRREEWPVPQPMINATTRSFFCDKAAWPYVSLGPLHDSTEPGFILPPTNRVGIKRFLYFKLTSGGADTAWAFHPEDDVNGVWPMNEDLAYANASLLRAGMSRFPLGDLYHWYPSRYKEWTTQEDLEKARIEEWLAAGHDPGDVDAVCGQLPPVPEGPVSLSPGYPNPFNPSTSIRLTLLSRRSVQVRVFDILGREVAVLLAGEMDQGTYNLFWDARGAASGAYLCRATSGTESVARRLLLIR